MFPSRLFPVAPSAPFPTVSRPTVYPVVPIPPRRSHTISPIPHLTIILGQLFLRPIPFTTGFLVSSYYMTMDATRSCYFGFSSSSTFSSRFILFSLFSFFANQVDVFLWSLANSTRDREAARSRRLCFSGSTSQVRTKFLGYDREGCPRVGSLEGGARCSC